MHSSQAVLRLSGPKHLNRRPPSSGERARLPPRRCYASVRFRAIFRGVIRTSADEIYQPSDRYTVESFSETAPPAKKGPRRVFIRIIAALFGRLCRLLAALGFGYYFYWA